MDIELIRNLCLDAIKEGLEFSRSMPSMSLTDDLAAGHVEGGEERGGAVPAVIMGAPLGHAGAYGRMVWVRSRARIWLFSSTHRTGA
jgi:hypothetical protein